MVSCLRCTLAGDLGVDHPSPARQHQLGVSGGLCSAAFPDSHGSRTCKRYPLEEIHLTYFLLESLLNSSPVLPVHQAHDSERRPDGPELDPARLTWILMYCPDISHNSMDSRDTAVPVPQLPGFLVFPV